MLLQIPHNPDVTSILLIWTPSTGVNGYIISYDNGEASSATVTVTDGSTERELLTGLQNGIIYNISIIARSIHFNNERVQFDPVELVEGELELLFEIKLIKYEVGCRDDTVPKTVETRMHCEED